MNSGPQTGVGEDYWGWEPWANDGSGTNTGPSGFRAPDFTGVNSTHSGTWPNMNATGQMPMPYLIFSYIITTGSVWTSSISGQDLVRKSQWFQDEVFTNESYDYYARNVGIQGSVFTSAFMSCNDTNLPTLQKFTDIAKVLATGLGAGAYHDTVGNWGRGCYSRYHQYIPTFIGDQSGVINYVAHPRGSFTHYYNQQQQLWLSGFTDVIVNSGASQWPGTGQNKFSQAQFAEWPTDANLSYLDGSLLYEGATVLSPSYFHLKTSGRPDGVGASYIAGLSYNTTAIEPRHWRQRSPMFSIIYGDRCMFTDWTTPHISNAMNISGAAFTAGEITGYHTTSGIWLKAAQTHEHRQLDWASYTATQFPWWGRLTVFHQSLDAADINSKWSGTIEDHDAALFGTEWSGYTDYIVTLERLMGYEPDYMYHGTIEHPLETWEIERSLSNNTTRGLRQSRPPMNETPTSEVTGDDVIVHAVRRHRANDNLLIYFNNWYTGTKTFSGTFEPDTYEFTKSYDVYSLSVTGGNHGTKTRLTGRALGEDHVFEVTLPQLGVTALEFQQISTAGPGGGVISRFSDLQVDYSYVRYAYDFQDLAISWITLPYSHGTQCQSDTELPLQGFRAGMGQQIVNNLPPWMLLRQDEDTRGWKLMNSWGMNLEELLQDITEKTQDAFLLTSDTTRVNQTFWFDVNIDELLEERPTNNLLYNSAFSIKDVSRTKLPAGWTDYYKPSTQTVFIDKVVSMLGTNSIRMEKTGTLGQTRELNNVQVDNLTASVYVLCDDPTVEMTLVLSVEKIGGTSVSTQAKVTSRSGQWRRLSVTLPVMDQVFRVQYVLHSDVFERCYFCAPQLEVGDSASAWMRSNLDTVPYIAGDSSLGTMQVYGGTKNTPKISIHGIASEREFVNIGIPTRVEKRTVIPKDLGLFATQSFGRRVTQANEVYDTEWVIQNRQVLERSFAPTKFDVFGRFDIKELRVFEDTTYGIRDEGCDYFFNPLATAVRKNLLFVASQEIFRGKTYYTLKVVRPQHPPNDETYLESLADFDLELPFSQNFGIGQLQETISSIGFSEINPKWMVVNTTASRRFFYEL
ncbi:MAG: hypothetical protein ACXABY_17035, partial [Candidatus Thorarchaeota archaeon]